MNLKIPDQNDVIGDEVFPIAEEIPSIPADQTITINRKNTAKPIEKNDEVIRAMGRVLMLGFAWSLAEAKDRKKRQDEAEKVASMRDKALLN